MNVKPVRIFCSIPVRKNRSAGYFGVQGEFGNDVSSQHLIRKGGFDREMKMHS